MGIEILDCTIRDGGYYCNWDFDDALIERYLYSMSESGIQYVEIGFRSNKPLGFAGKYKFCREHSLRKIFPRHSLSVAVMIDGKDFILPNDLVDQEALLCLFGPCDESVIHLVRMTATTTTLPIVIKIGEILKQLGYEISINIMQVSMLSAQELCQIAEFVEQSGSDILYLADSFGGLSPRETEEMVMTVKKSFSGRIGFHAHDNLGLALANALAAIKGGAELIDCSLLGMGRGAGNLRTEQLLLYLSSKQGYKNLDPTPLFDVVLTEFVDLQKHLQWGTNLPYMLAGVHGVHPMYPQHLLQVYRYSPQEVIGVLESLRDSGAGRVFNPESLSRALNHRFRKAQNNMNVTQLTGFSAGFPKISCKSPISILLLGSGPSTRARADDINEYIRVHQPVVVECNLQSSICPSTSHFSLFTNNQRLEEHASFLGQSRSHLILGLPELSVSLSSSLEQLSIYHYPYKVVEDQFEVQTDLCTIPHDVVAMYGFAFALRMEPESIYLCGFDGYRAQSQGEQYSVIQEDLTMEREMENFFRLLSCHEAIRKGTKVVSLTPTAYSVDQESLYAYL